MSSERVFNFSAGPSMLPLEVLEQVREEFLSYQGLGTSIIEMSHLSPHVKGVILEAELLLRELLDVPKNYCISFVLGGGRTQFSMVPLNLMQRKPSKRAQFVVSGNFSEGALAEAQRYGEVEVIASSKGENYASIPALDDAKVDPEASYLHITTNNTAIGTRWQQFPQLKGGAVLVGDMTSEILSRPFEVKRFGLVYAGAQKNLGPAGMSAFIIREDLLNHAMPTTPKTLSYATLVETKTVVSTPNVFSIYVSQLVLQWVKRNGGVKRMAQHAAKRSGIVYDALDACRAFYTPHAHPQHRSTMNVTFCLPDAGLTERFLRESEKEGLVGLKGHRFLGGIRASMYIAMPFEGANALAGFMREFAHKNG